LAAAAHFIGIGWSLAVIIWAIVITPLVHWSYWRLSLAITQAGHWHWSLVGHWPLSLVIGHWFFAIIIGWVIGIAIAYTAITHYWLHIAGLAITPLPLHIGYYWHCHWPH